MHFASRASTVLLLVSVAAAQSLTSALSINPGGPNTPIASSASACAQVCVQGACHPCSASQGSIGILSGETPQRTTPVSVSNTGAVSVSSAASSAASSGLVPGTKPTVITSKLNTVSSVPHAQSTSAPAASNSAATTATPPQKTNAASPAFDSDGASYVLAVAGVALALL